MRGRRCRKQPFEARTNGMRRVWLLPRVSIAEQALSDLVDLNYWDDVKCGYRT